MNNNLIAVEHVTKEFATKRALDDISLEIPKGSIYGLLGPNGAGKSTLIRIINRITAPDKGRVLFEGHEIQPEDIYQIGYLPEERGLYKKMKVGEQAIFFARLKGISRKDAITRLKYWFKKFGIEDWWGKKVDELSKGMAQKVQFIITILHEPKLLIFDEPFSGFDPVNANLLKEEILNMRDKGATVIFSTHNMASVEEICDHITLINNSKNILSGSVNEIRYRHGSNLFSIGYKGEEADTSRLKSSLTSICEITPEFRKLKEDEGPWKQLLVHVSSEDDLKQVIAMANETVTMHSFQEVIPSMNDIFIRAVNGQL